MPGEFSHIHDPSPLAMRMIVEASAATLSAISVGTKTMYSIKSINASPNPGLGDTKFMVYCSYIAPAISIVDRAIVSNASGLEPMVPALINGVKTLITRPLYFVRQPSFLFICGVYSGTYIVVSAVCCCKICV